VLVHRFMLGASRTHTKRLTKQASNQGS